MDSIGEGPLKLGRISRKVEKALGLSLVCDVNIYLPQPQLDQLAASRPHDYLKRLDEISGICRDPDYVRYDESNDTFIYLKEYIKDGVFLKVAVDLTHAQTRQLLDQGRPLRNRRSANGFARRRDPPRVFCQQQNLVLKRTA